MRQQRSSTQAKWQIVVAVLIIAVGVTWWGATGDSGPLVFGGTFVGALVLVAAFLYWRQSRQQRP
jgi:hypothetical protein